MPRQLVTSLVEDAVTAPSMHNAQPWRFVHRTGDGTVELHGDPARTMPHGDPDRRALHLGCGAALFNLRVAVAHRGLHADTRLLPSPADPWHLADLRLRTIGAQDDDLKAFHPALRRRHTNRFPFSEERIPSEVTGGLCAAALLEGCRLVVPGTWHTDTVLDLVHDSEMFEAANAAVRTEIATWTRTGAADEGAETRSSDLSPCSAQRGTVCVTRHSRRGRPRPGRGRPRCGGLMTPPHRALRKLARTASHPRRNHRSSPGATVPRRSSGSRTVSGR
ncbi:hypothetical protein AB0F57_36975 [Streptomyces tanashiensis]|uniref:hypothetical protein n=1 Tax=Streptomyces tanashiensis TaxID=67367 RepID=UPI0033E42F4D